MDLRRAAGLACTGILLAGLAVPASAAAPATQPGAIGPAPTTLYLDALFDLFLGRSPTAQDIDHWSHVAHRGDLTAVTRALATSDEWAGRRIDDLYRTVLDRPPDPSGRAHWLQAIAEGLLLEEVAARLFGSTEYYRGAGGDDRAFVDGLYDDLLGRPADDGGRSHWMGRIDGGAARHVIAGYFYASAESRLDRVAATYREVLARDPDPGGHAHWAGRILQLGEVSLAASLAASSEFHGRATGVPAPWTAIAPVGPGTTHPLTHSWRAGCPVHHRDLVAVEFTHLLDDGTVQRGSVVVHRTIAGDVAVALRTLYGSGFPLTSALPIDAFGGDDGRSMEADNTSAFNCRVVAGTTTWSQHAYGLALDLNPRRNPYVRGSHVEPPSGAQWVDRDDVRPGMIVEGGPVVAVFDRLGWGWGGRWSDAKDYQHFSTTGR